MEQKLDLRIQKTYLALTKAFTELLEEKRFEDITVNELCERAMVRRATFYKHFGDKYEFFTFMVHLIQDEYNEKNTKNRVYERPQEYYVGVVESLLDFLIKHEGLVKSVLKSSTAPALMDILAEQIIQYLQMQFRSDEKKGITLPAPPAILAQIFTGALLQAAKWWIAQENRIEKEELIAQIEPLIFRL